MSATADHPEIDSDFASAGIARYREVAKWIVGSVGGIAVVLAAGLQITSIGDLAGWDLGLALLAVLGLIGSAMYIVKQALSVLEPLEVRIAAVDPIVMDELIASDLVPFDFDSGAEVNERFEAIIGDPNLSERERGLWRGQAQTFVNWIALYTLRKRFRKATDEILKAAGIGVAALLLFAFVADQDESSTASSAMPPKPTPVEVTLSSEGRDGLRGLLGEACVDGNFMAVAISGPEDSPTLVSVPGSDCQVARFSVPDGQGAVQSVETVEITKPAEDDE